MSCQTIVPLNKSAYSTPANSYFKDLNNELHPYIGTWKTNFEDKSIILAISKEVKRPFEAWGKNFFKDQLIIRYEIKSSSGQILQSTLSNNFSLGDNVKNLLISVGTNIKQNDELNIVYAGGNCSIGMGEVTLKRTNAIQIIWSYYPQTISTNLTNCPSHLDTKIYLPEVVGLLFTKQ